MIRMAVVDPDEVEVPLPGILIGVKDLQRIDRVLAGSVLRRGIPGSPGFLNSQLGTESTKQESATLFRVCLPGMILDGSKNRPRDLDRQAESSQ